MSEFRKALAGAKNIIIASGAGLSAPSGIATYRGTANSTWSNPRVVKYSRHETFKDDPSGSWQFSHHRRLNFLAAKPNAAHLALAAIYKPDVKSRVFPSAVSGPVHVTQNIDELSVRALKLLPESSAKDGLENLFPIHGSFFRTRCLSCKQVKHSYEPFLAEAFKDLPDGPDDFVDIPVEKLPKCGGDQWAGSNRYGNCGGLLRLDVVWFGEVPPLMGEVARKVTWCDLLIVIGTSAVVQPVAEFASQVRGHGGKVAVFNIDRSNHDEEADFLFLGSCDVTVPEAFDVTMDIKDLE